jgi:hypothetical protein
VIIHKELAAGRWFNLSLMEQLANIGADVDRVIRWKQKGNLEYSQKALDRVLELISLTLADPKNKGRLKEVARARELLIDYFLYDNEYNSTDKFWQDYFFNFNYIVALQRGK